MTDKIFKDFADIVEARFNRYRGRKQSYAIPGLWMRQHSGQPIGIIVPIDPLNYFSESIRGLGRIKSERVLQGKGGTWSRYAVVYNMFVRSSCAFDHNQNGKLDLPLNQDGWRETGTFLKAITILPYIKSLGVNTVHFLPITAIGSDGKKGTLGSPYSIKNPYKIDETLSEPNLGIGSDEEFRMFVHAAHHMGIRVVIEFVFRTAAKDTDWIHEHPEWFYWIKESAADREPDSRDETRYGNPIFFEDELRIIKSMVGTGNLENLPPPHDQYRRLFTDSPALDKISLEHGKFIGIVDGGTRVRIPGAFTDWPPDDIQPPWNDVTYLKMYRHPDFNYIAYNTIRMYEKNFSRPENINDALWEKIIDIIPHYQEKFDIDGVMIDMGHALPMDLKRQMIEKARNINSDFAFWDENFSVTERSVREGYNAVIGYQWSDQHHPVKYQQMLRRFEGEGFSLPFFATPESHNTPRAAARDGGMRYSRYAWALSNFIPAIPFIHSGFELGETNPVNTGLDFTGELLRQYPSERLPLFSEAAYAWLNGDEITEWITNVSNTRARYVDLICDSAKESFRWVESQNPDLIAFMRGRANDTEQLLILANANMKQSFTYSLTIETRKEVLSDLLDKKSIVVNDNTIGGTLEAGEVNVFLI
jgi:hypothetical protein